MKKILNPFVGKEGYNCIGCDPNHPFGLKLNFFLDEERKIIFAEWSPNSSFQGYHNVLHGGIQATLLDEIGGWAVNTILGTGGVTSRLQIRYKKPVFITDGPIRLKAWLLSNNKGLAEIQTQLFSKDELCAEAQVQYFVYPPEVAKRKLHFPGAEEFFED